MEGRKIFKVVFILGMALFAMKHLLNADPYGESANTDQFGQSTKTELSEEEPEATILTKSDSIVDYAMTLLGREYRYGKIGPDAFDCSGFVFHVYSKFDVQLPRSTKIQVNEGVQIELKDVEKGDLLFFKSPTPGNTNIGHVGIVVRNESDTVSFIHSSTGRGVIVDNVERSYKRRYMQARRVL